MRFYTLIYLIISTPILLAQTFTSNPNALIPSFACTDYTINVTGLNATMDNTFGLEEVCIDITHTWVGELTVSLISPGGTTVVITEENGGNGDNYAMTCFDGDTANPLISSGTAQF